MKQTDWEKSPAAMVMRVTLGAAVPMWILEIKGWSAERRIERAAECGQVVAEKGDVLQFGGKKGQAAEVFNRLAEGLACLAYQPGGVKFLGMHWEARRSLRVPLPPPPVR